MKLTFIIVNVSKINDYHGGGDDHLRQASGWLASSAGRGKNKTLHSRLQRGAPAKNRWHRSIALAPISWTIVGGRYRDGRLILLYSEDDLVLISALQHILFCERQYALIHIEQVWEENRFTAEGKVLHERVDAEHHESRRLFRQEYGMAVRSLERGLIGKCDLVELHLAPGGGVAEAVPVEFKRGRTKEDDVDRVQLCAQAFCLEEMFGVQVAVGQLYYLQEHRRTTVDIDGPLRAKTMELVARVRQLHSLGITPPALYGRRKCDRCSLFELCMPKSAGSGGKRVDRFVQSQIRAAREECGR